jgi:hypothetical protein
MPGAVQTSSDGEDGAVVPAGGSIGGREPCALSSNVRRGSTLGQRVRIIGAAFTRSSLPVDECGDTTCVQIWPRVDVLVERSPSVASLHHHRLHLYAAWRWRSAGRPIPAQLAALERGAAATRASLGAMAQYVREAHDGPIVLLKGADVAALYPRRDLRPSHDLDLLVPNAEQTHRALLERGFAEDRAGSLPPSEHHHLIPLMWPGLPGRVEVHSAPNWPPWLSSPPSAELFEAAAHESVTGSGILALSPVHRTLVLVAHLWCDDPLGRMGHLLDVLLAAEQCDEREVMNTARRWGLERPWRTTQAVGERVFAVDFRAPRRARQLGGGLASMRERTVLSARAAEAAAPFYGLPPARAAVASVRTVFRWLLPEPDESWFGKARSAFRALRMLLAPASHLDREREEPQRGPLG